MTTDKPLLPTQADREAARNAVAVMMVAGFQGDPAAWQKVDLVFAEYRAAIEARLSTASSGELREALKMISGHIRNEDHSFEDDYFACKSIADAALSTPVEQGGSDLRADAERWRAFISSDRFYVMGWAGFTNDRENPQVKRRGDDWLHFTLNVWDTHPAGDDEQGRHGRALLLAYVEHLRAALSEQEPKP